MRFVKLGEKILSKNYAICYHRTNSPGIISILKDQAFYPGGAGGAMYGPGFYFTYEEEAQWNDHMEQFGKYMVKARVPLHGILIFDEDVAKQVYGKDWDIPDQVRLIANPKQKVQTGMASTSGSKLFWKKNYDDFDRKKDAMAIYKACNKIKNLKGTIVIVTNLKMEAPAIFEKVTRVALQENTDPVTDVTKWDIWLYSEGDYTNPIILETREVSEVRFLLEKIDLEDLDDWSIHNQIWDYTSEMARRFYTNFSGYPWYSKLKGLMYSGSQDGQCVVVYDYDDVIPLSVLVAPRVDWAPEDGFKSLIDKVETIFTKPETEKLLSTEWTNFTKYIYDYYNEDDPDNTPEKFGLTSVRRKELCNYFIFQSKGGFSRAELEEIIYIYGQIKYHKGIDFSVERNAEAGSDALNYYQGFVRNTLPAVELFMDNDEYCKPRVIDAHWEPIDRETLKYFLKNGLVKK
jgi:hypothetical protein